MAEPPGSTPTPARSPSRRRRRPRTGDPALDELLRQILDEIDPGADRELLLDILVSAVRLARDGADRLDLKITGAALKEMRSAFRAFGPYRHIPKVTIFGSARTKADDPAYTQARDFARRLSDAGWMVVTGAGPGIMAAGLEGAGRERSFGVNIRLPFESSANEFIVGDEKLISMKYFFTRKLMLIKESRGFASLPGGFGTLDETFELLTLQQTGKSVPAPIVLLDEPGGSYWTGWQRFVDDEVAGRRLIDAWDHELFTITDDAEVAAATVIGFYRNFHSIRWIGDQLVIRLEALPTDAEVEQLNRDFADVCAHGSIERADASLEEVADGDEIDRPRLALELDIFRYGRLRALINALNDLPSAPAIVTQPPP